MAPATTRRSRVGAFLEILTAICNIGTAVALYPWPSRYSHRAALGYVALRIVESTIIVAGVVSVLSVLTLRQQFTGADAGAFTVAGQTLVAFHDWTFLLGPGFCAGIGNGLLLGSIMYRSGLLPRRAGDLRARRRHASRSSRPPARCSASTSASPRRSSCSPSRR